ncbi:hypothetical protein RHGRI_025254 [Rhododendron griersonianum]|uniref:K Homology domain-containing protein n=1 Tax=Rhododendron griersonianum TaxID=479676 RepID=A0AAV6JDW3_9ERIC|nr:hypothetical protein RHGRI_025254 [Rhododendron griersonianum]
MGETVFRILCPAGQTGGIVRNGGAFIRQVREETGARIRVEDSVPGCKERVIVIVSDKESTTSKNIDASGDESVVGEDEEVSQGQQALVRVFERIAEERSGVSSTESEFEERDGGGGHNNIGGGGEGAVVCRLLAPSSQVGCVLGRGGRIVERIRHDSGARVRVLQYDQIPPCALPGDELIQITGKFSAVRKALLSVSSCLQVNSGANAVNSAATRSSGLAQHGTGTENIGPNLRLVVTEEEVVFRLLCQVDKIRSLIGKGGSIMRVLQSETGASIKIADSAPDSDETVVHSEQRHSSAQDAVIRVHCRIAEIGFERGAAVVARLLVHSQQIGCLLGKGGSIINELRRVIGSLQSVQDALFRITSRLRQTIFAVKSHHPGVSGSQYLPPYSEMPPPMFRSRHDPGSPGHYPSPAILPRGVDRVPFPPQPLDPRPFSHDTDHVGPTYFDRMPYPYGSERPGHGPSFDWQPSPREWTYQAGSRGNPREVAEIGGGFAFSSIPIGSRSLAPNSASTTVEVVIPQTLLGHVYGENNGNLNQIRQISGAEVFVHDPRPGATEGVAVVSGMLDQLHAAQSLIHAFILAELPF